MDYLQEGYGIIRGRLVYAHKGKIMSENDKPNLNLDQPAFDNSEVVQPVDNSVDELSDGLSDTPAYNFKLDEPDAEPPTEPVADPETAPVMPKAYGPYPKKMYHRFGLSSRLVGSKQEEINMGSEWGDKPFPSEYAIIEEKIPSHRFI